MCCKEFNKKKTEYLNCVCLSWLCSILDMLIILKFQTNPGNLMINTRPGNVMAESGGNKTSSFFHLCVYLSVQTLVLPLSRFKEFVITSLKEGGNSNYPVRWEDQARLKQRLLNSASLLLLCREYLLDPPE